MKHINCLLNSEQYDDLMTLLRDARMRSLDGILTCPLDTEQVDELMEVLL